MNREEAIKAAENEGITFERADSLIDVYLDTRGNEANIEKFIQFVFSKVKA